MAFEQLSPDEQEIIRRCMTAILDGPYIEDVHFGTRLGLDRSEMREIVAKWPDLDDSDPDVDLAINNSLNEVCNGVRITAKEWARRIGEPKEAVERTYNRWTELQGRSHTGIR